MQREKLHVKIGNKKEECEDGTMAVYGVVLAGGQGKRMGNVEKPKQFLTIGKKPIIVHTVEKFCVNSRIDKVLVLCPEKWISYTKDLLKKHLSLMEDKIEILAGGETRNDTILNAVTFIENNCRLDEAIMVTHDAVRPFVTHRIIEENIEAVLQGNACDTVMPATDTIVESLDGESISSIPDRSHYYQGQTPQSFRADKFKELYMNLTTEEKAILTDAAKVFVIKGEKVTLIQGETFNIKVTYPYDLQLAETLLSEGRNC